MTPRTKGPDRPPAIAEALLKRCVPVKSEGRCILGDLHEEFAERCEVGRRWSARAWYWSQAIAIGGGYLLARRRFGAAPHVLPKAFGGGMSSLVNDVRYAFRTLARTPGFAAVVVVTLALGIGANTAIFSTANALLIRPFPVDESERLVSVFTSYVGGDRHSITSYPDYADLRDRNSVLSGLAAQTYVPMGLTGDDGTDVVTGQLVSWNYFSVLGVETHLGRAFIPEEDAAEGTHPVAILSHRVWERRFGADPGIIGSQVLINSHPFTVVGVAAEHFRGVSVALATDLWVPLRMVEQAAPFTPQFGGRIDPWLYLIGRLQPDVSLEQARAAMEALGSNLEREYPELNQGKAFTVLPISQSRVGTGSSAEVGGLVAGLMAVVGVVLLIAILNVANLHLARATKRHREIAMRCALGASRGRIFRQLLTESVVLSVLAAAAGLVLAAWLLDLLSLLQPAAAVPIELDLSFDRPVLGFTLLLSLLTGALFGLAPAVHTIRSLRVSALKNEPLPRLRRRGKSRLQSSLVVPQVALSLVLLISAGLFLRSLQNTVAVDPGFDLPNGLIVSANLGFSQYDEVDGRAFQQRLLDRIVGLPGVDSAALAAFLPLGDVHGRHDIYIDGYDPQPDERMVFLRNMVGDRYFRVMNVPVVRGRGFDERDRADSKPVAVINETMARRFWQGRDPIGGTIWADLGVEREVVGIVKDGRYGSLEEEPQPYLYIPMNQAEYLQVFNVIARTAADPGPLLAVAQRESRALDPDLPAPTIAAAGQLLDRSVGGTKALMIMVGAFGLLATTLAMVGLYGVMSYSVSRRTHEFGVRRALGAEGRSIVTMVLMRGLRTTLVGVAAGLALAFAVTRLLSASLYRVDALDPVVFASVPVILVTTALIAALVPALLASRVDPIEALRAE